MNCPICLSSMIQWSIISLIITTPCCHQKIHKSCIYKWLEDENKVFCPLCREGIGIVEMPIHTCINRDKCIKFFFLVLYSIFIISILLFTEFYVLGILMTLSLLIMIVYYVVNCFNTRDNYYITRKKIICL